MNERPNQFDDRGLKDAIRQAWPAGGASEMTRARIAKLLKSELESTEAALGATPNLPGQRSVVRWLAVAASVLIGLGVAGWVGYQAYEAYEYREYVAVNMDRFTQLVRLQIDGMPAEAEASADPAAAARQLQRRVASIPPEAGWAMQEVSIVPFFGDRLVAVRYSNSGSVATVFSIPASVFIDVHDGFAYTVTASTGVLTGSIDNDTAFCIAGSREADRTLIETLARQLRIEVPPAPAPE